MITLTVQRRYVYPQSREIHKNTILASIETVEKPIKRVIESFWNVLTSPVEKS